MICRLLLPLTWSLNKSIGMPILLLMKGCNALRSIVIGIYEKNASDIS